ncbi:MAG: UvrB/UvrC motif-containing protein [Phycisphaerales bacterium]|nr:UvrB/UvrC motif-containing protein [Phycisphaerales bacterium]
MSHHQDDLTDLLRRWPHEQGRITARRIAAGDGRPLVQVRLELGLLQMEWTGRPDGQQPDGAPSLFDLHRDRLATYAQESGNPEGFVLGVEDCRALRDEAVQYYHRYVAFMALGEHEGVVRDTTRNLALFDFCRDYAAAEPDRQILEQFRPHVLTMRARARAEAALAAGRPDGALEALNQGLAEIRHVFDDAGIGDAYDASNEVQLLRGMRDALVPQLPVSQRSELEERIRAAIDAENYELAAILRDELRILDDRPRA